MSSPAGSQLPVKKSRLASAVLQSLCFLLLSSSTNAIIAGHAVLGADEYNCRSCVTNWRGVIHSVQDERINLKTAVDRWIEVAERIRSSGALVVGGSIPNDLTDARAMFERAWIEAGRAGRREVDRKRLSKAFSLLIRSYRHQENGNPNPRLALSWADEMINFYGQEASRRELAEAMLEKAAVYLEVSQLNHTDHLRFDQVSRDGDKLLQDCMGVAESDQKTEVLRFWSRFYYNLARPSSGRLSDPWDPRFLALADQRIDNALELEPELLRNLNQKARVTQRRARATLDAPLEKWSNALWSIQKKFVVAWNKAQANIDRPADKISTLNVLAMVTLDAVMYTLSVSDETGKKTIAPHFMEELDKTAIPSQIDAWAIIHNTELAKTYGFDTNYDLARLYALRADLAAIIGTGRQNEDHDAAARYLFDARGLATVPQLDAAKASLESDPVFNRLPKFVLDRYKQVLDGKQP